MKTFKIIVCFLGISVLILSFSSLKTRDLGIINSYSESFSIFNETVEISTNPFKNIDLIGNSLDKAINFEY